MNQSHEQTFEAFVTTKVRPKSLSDAIDKAISQAEALGNAFVRVSYSAHDATFSFENIDPKSMRIELDQESGEST